MRIEYFQGEKSDAATWAATRQNSPIAADNHPRRKAGIRSRICSSLLIIVSNAPVNLKPSSPARQPAPRRAGYASSCPFHFRSFS
ncbi:MAG: hypothetical protein A2498_16445 [Lentisphaerae bacterium RIFOXYC12_FULL_60_16]|nr:MAG: hypothetical protein A2498_16445 [Lentisphaerae bacterium RIFOXYC12_FULL_60_16]